MPVRKTERRLRRCEYAGAMLFALILAVGLGPVNNHAKRQKMGESPVQWRVVDLTVKPGDTLLTVLRQFDVSSPTARAMIGALRPFVNPREIQPGRSLQVILDPQQGTLKGLTYRLVGEEVRVVSTPEGWSAERSEIPSTRKTLVARGIVVEDFYRSGTEAGLTPELILAVADIFEYDIDFFSDFRRGDTFSVAFEEIRYADGHRAPGRILAAELTAGSTPFNAFYYTRQGGAGAYYDINGRSLHGAFLRAPLSYRQITSRYNLKRRHPILRTVRPHRAIDYAAAPGTPVVSVGPGTIKFVGRRKGYGKLVEIRHPNGYTTRYAHLSRIASGFHSGSRIDQGNVIGYVGQTGTATGPNLHFEILRGQNKIDFLALRLPRRQRITGEELARFIDLRDRRLALLRGRITSRLSFPPQRLREGSYCLGERTDCKYTGIRISIPQADPLHFT